MKVIVLPTDYHRASQYIENLQNLGVKDSWKQRLASKTGVDSQKVPHGVSLEEFNKRWELLSVPKEKQEIVADQWSIENRELFRHNIENYIGTVKIPVGLAGPLRVNGLFAQGDYYIPLATTEAALVASYSRGSQLITDSGGCTAILLNEGISRAPGFVFNNLLEVSEFIEWALSNANNFKQEAESTTAHGKFIDMKITIEGNHVYLIFEFATSDAAGQNMITFATETVCKYILKNSPVSPQYVFIEANLSGDKKASAQSLQSVRGKKVTSEVIIKEELIKTALHATPESMAQYWRMGAMGSVLSGTVGVQGHYANGLAALYIACGQDAACVAESAIGVSRFDVTKDGDLYASVTLPNLTVGTVGGGTSLPSQNIGLEILGLSGSGKARAFAEVCAALVLAGEISLVGAIVSGDFSRAHKLLAHGHSKHNKR